MHAFILRLFVSLLFASRPVFLWENQLFFMARKYNCSVGIDGEFINLG